MSKINTDEVVALLKAQLANFKTEGELEETGVVKWQSVNTLLEILEEEGAV